MNRWVSTASTSKNDRTCNEIIVNIQFKLSWVSSGICFAHFNWEITYTIIQCCFNTAFRISQYHTLAIYYVWLRITHPVITCINIIPCNAIVSNKRTITIRWTGMFKIIKTFWISFNIQVRSYSLSSTSYSCTFCNCTNLSWCCGPFYDKCIFPVVTKAGTISICID